MAKIHSRTKRSLGGGTTLRCTRPANRDRAKRARSFKSEETAKKWAETQGIKDYTLKNIRAEYASDKKIIVVKTIKN